MTGRPRLTFMLVGGADIVVRCGAHILSIGHAVVHVIARSPAVRGWAEENGLPWTAGLPEAVGSLPPFDHIISAANDLILPDSLIARARRGAFNLHNSALPDYRGAFATLWAILDGRTTHGASWHRITARIDAGPIAAVARFAILPHDTAQTLNARCMEAGFALFRETLMPALEQGVIDGDTPPLSPYFAVARRAPALGVIDWRAPATQGERMVRALARGTIDNSMDLAKIMSGPHCWSVGTAALPDSARVRPGEIRTIGGGEWLLGTVEGDLLLGDIALCGPPMRDGVPAPTLAEAVPDDLVERVQQLGRAAATLEQSALHDWAEASRLPPLPHPQADAPIAPAADGWRTSAPELLAAARTGGGTAYRFDLRTPRIRNVPPGLRPLFCPFVPFRLLANEGEDQLAERLAKADRDGPMLIDAWNRRTILRALAAQKLIYSDN